MARIFIDGFEDGTTGLWTLASSASSTTSPPSGMSGSYYLEVNSNHYLRKTFPSSFSQMYLAVKIKMTSTYTEIFTLMDSAGTNIFAISKTAAHYLQCWRGGYNSSAIGSLSSVPITVGQVYLLEVYYKPLNTDGLVTVKLDGTTVISIVAGDHVDTTAGLENIMQIAFGSLLSSTCVDCIDDVVIDDANWIGNTKITAIAPTGAGATSGWTPTVITLPKADAGSALSWSNKENIRHIVSASQLSYSGTSVRLLLRGHSSYAETITGCSIGLRSGSTDDFSGAPTRVTFSGSNSGTIPAGGILYSDWITFSIDESLDYLVHLYYGDSGTIYYGRISDAAYTSYYKATDDDDTETQSVSGYSTSSGYYYGLAGIQVRGGTYVNASAVDEAPAEDDDYTYTNTENAVDTYAMGNLPGTGIGTIKAVAVQSRNWRVGNGTVSKLQHVLRPASTDRVGATVNGGAYIPVSATSFQTIWELNPEDSAAWEKADINALEAGIKAVTS